MQNKFYGQYTEVLPGPKLSNIVLLSSSKGRVTKGARISRLDMLSLKQYLSVLYGNEYIQIHKYDSPLNLNIYPKDGSI